MSDTEKHAEAPSEEYATLIQFIRDQKTQTNDEDAGDGSRIVKKRSLLTPWKTREVRVNKEGEEEQVAAKVPASW
jgi:H+-transporting ATPase